ncbi:nuclear transport factor 2 family protein [Aurantiacibacter spongiae]|uniref:Nuclear transport factor 2 family protein n=1 Tax=Aurantiacibacter spongiae TaxID=2488860 RepID=A0A3N5CQP3_9SPHN|nr:nuclear transport factor 2 family protein [Aurantiacibacter spongiae]RPF71393.1 nuclear transport factor 2 family protein [Aurantiacibacter spongiae]
MTDSGAQRDTLSLLHAVIGGKEPPGALAERIADDAVFHSPVMHTPQEGRDLVMQYLGAALQLFSAYDFCYVREIVDGREAMLEFTLTIEGTFVNGIDVISFDEAGNINDFKVFLRPLQGMQKVREKMMAQMARG